MADDTHPYDQLIASVREDMASGTLPNHEVALSRLTELRNFTEFDLMAELAEVYLAGWPSDPELTKLYGQALIDTGRNNAAIGVLGHLKASLDPAHPEFQDICGIYGRAHKDLFLAAHATDRDTLAQRYAQQAFDAYFEVYQQDPDGNFYHGVNAMALAAFAKDDGVSLQQSADARQIAQQLVASLSKKSADDPWIAASLAEAYVALGEWDDVDQHLGTYVAHENVTPFQIQGTLRQFKDVWCLERRGKRAQQTLSLLQAAALNAGRLKGTYQSVCIEVPQECVSETPSLDGLEKILGHDGLLTYQWLQLGFERARSVAAVLTRRRARIGTAFVIDPQQFQLTNVAPDRICLMTNYHVLNEDGFGGALTLASGGKVRFEAHPEHGEEVFNIKEILFQSHYDEPGLDCTIFTIEADESQYDFQAIPIDTDLLPDLSIDPKPRVYIIGHPRGGELQFTLQDNRILDHEGPDQGDPPMPKCRRVHYFAPTEPGNSGSPVFDDAWYCIALHHKGLKHDPAAGQHGLRRLNQKDGRYSANQGIWIGSIIEAVKKANDNQN